MNNFEGKWNVFGNGFEENIEERMKYFQNYNLSEKYFGFFCIIKCQDKYNTAEVYHSFRSIMSSVFVSMTTCLKKWESLQIRYIPTTSEVMLYYITTVLLFL